MTVPSRELAESYRKASASLVNTLKERKQTAVIFSSPTAGEGTTTVVTRICNHLITDCGLRALRVTLDSSQTLPADKLSDAGGSRLPFKKVIEKDSFGVDHISLKSHRNNNAGPGASALKILLEEVQEQYDMILVDAPPLLTNSETFEAANLAQNLVLVVQTGKTRYEILERVKSELEQHNITLIGTILNAQKRYIPRWVYRWFFQ